MPAPLTVPVGELTSLGIAKEVNFGTFVAPTLFHAIENFHAQPKNLFVPRTGARKRRGQNLPIVAGFEGTATVAPEPDPDTLGQLLAFTMGAQTTPVLVGTETLAYTSALTLGALPSFSTEVNYVTDAIDYLGCMIESASIGFKKSKGLVPSFTFGYQNEIVQATPTTPTFSTKLPPAFENASNSFTIAAQAYGPSGAVTVHDITINISNNLDKSYRSFGGGRNIITFPQQQRKVTGKIQLGFETDLIRQKFYGAATGPASAVPGISIDAKIYTTDQAGAVVPTYFAFDFLMANCFITDYSTPITSNALIYQDFSFECAESANGANDDLKITLTNATSAVY